MPDAPRLGHYRLDSLLGKGGFGEVWKAWDEKLSRWVALKRLTLGDPDDAKRFLREAQTAASLNHPGIAAIYEVGDGWIAMQLINGETLRPGPDAVRHVRNAVRAVAFAHSKGIVHRDLKPANLMVEHPPVIRDPRFEIRVFVMDFGLARSIRPGSSLTASGALVGTPAYMSPEQARGERGDDRSDIYSLGATLHELVSGRPPFQGRNVLDVLTKIVADDPPPLPGDLGAIIAKCLEKDPARRYPSSTALADDLDRVLAGEPVVARPPSPARRLARRLSRHRAIALALAASAALAGGALAFLLPRLSASEKAAAKRAELQRIEDAIAHTRSRFYIPKADIRSELDKVERAVVSLQAHEPKDADIRTLLGIGWHLLGDERRAEESLTAAGADPRALFQLGRLRLEQALRTLLMSRPGVEPRQAARAEELCRAATECFDRCPPGDAGPEEVDRSVARAYAALARRDRKEIVRLCHDGLARFERRPGAEEFLMVLSWTVKDPREQMAVCEEALLIRPHFPWALVMRAALRRGLGDLRGAFDDCSAAIAITPRFAHAWNNRGLARDSLGDLDRARADFDEAIRLEPRFVEAWVNRANLRQRRGDCDGAIADATEAIRVDRGFDLGYMVRGTARHRKGDASGALDDFNAALDIHPRDSTLLRARAETRLELRDFKGASDDLEAAIEAEPGAAAGFALRARVRQRLHDSDGAIADCGEALRLDATCADAYVTRSQLRVLRGDPYGAVADASHAIRLKPDARAFGTRAAARVAAGDMPGVIADLDEQLRLDPRNHSSHTLRAYAKWRTGDLAGAASDFERALAIAPAGWDQRPKVEEHLAELRRKP